MKKLCDLNDEEVQVELGKRDLTIAGKDQELNQLLTDMSRQVSNKQVIGYFGAFREQGVILGSFFSTKVTFF